MRLLNFSHLSSVTSRYFGPGRALVVALMFHAAGEMCRAALQLYHVMWGVRVAECFWGKDGIEGIETSRTIVDWL